MNRRDFIKQLALLPVAAVLPALPVVVPTSTKVTKIGVTAILDMSAFSKAVDRYKQGLDASINDLIASARPDFKAMIEQIEREL